MEVQAQGKVKHMHPCPSKSQKPLMAASLPIAWLVIPGGSSKARTKTLNPHPYEKGQCVPDTCTLPTITCSRPTQDGSAAAFATSNCWSLMTVMTVTVAFNRGKVQWRLEVYTQDTHERTTSHQPGTTHTHTPKDNPVQSFDSI